MKMKISSIALSLLSLLIVCISCNYGSKNNTGTRDSNLAIDSVPIEPNPDTIARLVAPDIKVLLENILADQKSCAGDTTRWVDPETGRSKDCNTNYCGDPVCIKKIICCHEISSDTFKLIISKSSYLATFSERKFTDVLTQANCDKECIKFSRYNGFFRMERIDTASKKPSQYPTSYYSIALLRGIHDQKISKIVLYEGIQLSDSVAIVPFKVYFNSGDIKYYDVSNDLP